MSELERNATEWARNWADQVDVEIPEVLVVAGAKHSLITCRFGREDRFEALKVAMRYVDHGSEASLVRNAERGLDVRVRLDNRLFTHPDNWSDGEQKDAEPPLTEDVLYNRLTLALGEVERERKAVIKRHRRKAQEG